MNKLNKEIFTKEVLPKILKELDYTNPMMAPKLEKIVINIGAGDAAANQKIVDSIAEELSLITGQKPIRIPAKKSIAGFKLRENSIIGLKVTLRGNKMYNFLAKLVNVVIPRIRDFQGLNPTAFDGHGNYTLGIKEQIIFPEIEYDKVQKVRGMDITFVTSKENDNEAFVLLKNMGLPFAGNRKNK